MLVATIDVLLNGKRYRDHRNGMSIPPRIALRNAVQAVRHLDWTRAILRPPAIGFRNLKDEIQGNNAVSHQDFVKRYLVNLTLTWDDIAEVLRQWDGPIYLKGIFTPRTPCAPGRLGSRASTPPPTAGGSWTRRRARSACCPRASMPSART